MDIVKSESVNCRLSKTMKVSDMALIKTTLTNACGIGYIAYMTQFRSSYSCFDISLLPEEFLNLKFDYFSGWSPG